jgi:hypothetical protein
MNEKPPSPGFEPEHAFPIGAGPDSNHQSTKFKSAINKSQIEKQTAVARI